MTLNQQYTERLPPSPPHHETGNRELDEAQVTTAQQNAATLLYLKNRQEIWSTDKSALQGSAYSERLEKITKGDERLCDLTFEGAEHEIISPSLAGYMGLVTPIGLSLDSMAKTHCHIACYDPDTESLRQCEGQVNEASEVLKGISAKQKRSDIIPALENAFDKLDDVKILLNALDVETPLGKRKLELLAKADEISIAIEKVAQGLNS